MEAKTSVVLLLLVVFVTLLVYPKKRLHNNQAKIFTALLITSVINLLFDGITQYTVNHYADTLINDICHIVFIVSIETFAVLLFFYCQSNFKHKLLITKRTVIVHGIVYLACVIMSLVAPIRYVHGDFGHYSTGSKVYSLYICVAWFLVFIIYSIAKNYKNIEPTKRIGYLLSVITVMIVSLIQMVFPENLLSGIGIAFTVIGLMITNENQEKILDDKTTLFNEYAFKEILNDILKEKKKFVIGVVDFNELKLRLQKFSNEKFENVLMKYKRYIDKKYNKNIYQITETTVCLISNSENKIDAIMKDIISGIEQKTKIRRMFTKKYIINNTNGFVTQESVMNEILRFAVQSSNHEAIFDSFTGVKNRNSFESVKLHYEGTNNVYMIVDLNNLKLTNDTYGHSFGDDYLKRVSSILKKVARSDENVYRIGGDEFVIITDDKNRDRIIKDIRDLVNKDNEEVAYEMCVAYGYASFNEEDCYKKADKMMYEIKARQKNKDMIKSHFD